MQFALHSADSMASDVFESAKEGKTFQRIKPKHARNYRGESNNLHEDIWILND